MPVMSENFGQGSAFVVGGATTGAWVSLNIGGIGLSFSGTAVGLGLTPMTAAGAVTGAATYGAFKAVVEGDASAISAAALGGIAGASVSFSVGGIGLACKGTAISLGIAPITSAGMVCGLAVYGILKILDGAGVKESAQQIFSRMEEKISWQEDYHQALLDLTNNSLFGDPLERRYLAWECEQELQQLKESIVSQGFEAGSLDRAISALKVEVKEHVKADLEFIELEGVAFTFTKSQTVLPFVEDSSQVKQEHNEAHRNQRSDSHVLSIQPTYEWSCTQTIKGEFRAVNDVAVDKTNQTLATCHENGTINLWNLQNRRHQYCFIGEGKEITSLAFSPIDQVLVSGGIDRKLSVWNPKSLAYERTFFYLNKDYSHDGFIHSLAFSPDGKILASVGDDSKVRLWNPYLGRNIRILNGHDKGIFAVVIDPTGQRIISGGEDQTIKVWDLKLGHCIQTLNPESGCIFSLAINSDGHTFVSGGEDKKIKIWDLDSGTLRLTLEGHGSGVFSVAFSPDGQTLVSASIDEIKIWNFPSGKLQQTLLGANPITFSPDGRLLISGSGSGTIKVWEYRQFNRKSEPDLIIGGSWWEVFKVKRTANPSEVKDAYRRLARKYHPDVNASPDAEAWMQAINTAKREFEQQHRWF